jgi:hypothetical protein
MLAISSASTSGDGDLPNRPAAQIPAQTAQSAPKILEKLSQVMAQQLRSG